MMRHDSPAKRRRTKEEFQTSTHDDRADPMGIVLAMHQAVTASQRFEIINQLFQMIKYDITTRSCQSDPKFFMCLVDSGIVNALVLQLGFLLNRHGTSKEEIFHVCTALDVFYRFCPDLVSESSLRARGKELARLLYGALQYGTTLPVVSIWHSCSKSPFGTLLLNQDESFLRSITSIFQEQRLCREGCQEMLGLIKNISHHSDAVRPRIIEQPGLLSSIIALVEMPLLDKNQERLSAIFRNLALSAWTRKALAQRGDVLTSIVRLCNNATQQTLRNILNTLVSLAMEEESCLFLIFHCDGMIVELLKKVLFYELDETIRKRAARIFRLMTRESSLQMLVHDSKLMEMLSDRTLHDPSSDVRKEAAEAFGKYAGLVKVAMGQHDAVLAALTHLATTEGVYPDAIARAVKDQSSHVENRIPLSRCVNLLEALARVAASPTTSAAAKEDASNVFLDLSYDSETQSGITAQPILHSLVQNAENQDSRISSNRKIAVQTLVNLAKQPANRASMAKQSRLIQSLIQFAASTVEETLKREVKKVLLLLAAEL